jgi:hypothetical protein
VVASSGVGSTVETCARCNKISYYHYSCLNCVHAYCRGCWSDKSINTHQHCHFGVVEPTVRQQTQADESLCCWDANFGHCDFCKTRKSLLCISGPMLINFQPTNMVSRRGCVKPATKTITNCYFSANNVKSMKDLCTTGPMNFGSGGFWRLSLAKIISTATRAIVVRNYLKLLHAGSLLML